MMMTILVGCLAGWLRCCLVFSFGGFSGLGFYVKYTHRVHSQVEPTCPKGSKMFAVARGVTLGVMWLAWRGFCNLLDFFSVVADIVVIIIIINSCLSSCLYFVAVLRLA